MNSSFGAGGGLLNGSAYMGGCSSLEYREGFVERCGSVLAGSPGNRVGRSEDPRKKECGRNPCSGPETGNESWLSAMGRDLGTEVSAVGTVQALAKKIKLS